MKERTRRVLAYLVDRFKEPSTYRGMTLLFAVGGTQIKPDHAELILLVGIAFAGLLGVLLPEPRK